VAEPIPVPEISPRTPARRRRRPRWLKLLLADRRASIGLFVLVVLVLAAVLALTAMGVAGRELAVELTPWDG